MKLNDHLIVTIPDFSKHFSFNGFWENRKQFVRDMHPSKVYYWNEELKKAYDDITLWIKSGDNAEEAVINRGIHALELFVNRAIEKEELCGANSLPDLSSPIIRVQAGTTLELPQYNNEIIDSINLRFHKIEVYGSSKKPALIKIGSKEHITLYATEFTYVTEVANYFIEFMPTHMHNEVYDLSLISEDGTFYSTLNVKTIYSEMQVPYKEVISFAVTDDGFIFIDSQGNPIIFSNGINELKFMLKYDAKAFYVKAKGLKAAILYKDGTLKTTSGDRTLNKVVYANV